LTVLYIVSGAGHAGHFLNFIGDACGMFKAYTLPTW
jgi:hypothetical protein